MAANNLHQGRYTDLSTSVSFRRRANAEETTMRNTIIMAVLADAFVMGFVGFYYGYGKDYFENENDILVLAKFAAMGGAMSIGFLYYGIFQKCSNLVVRWVNSKTPKGWALAVVVSSISDIFTGIHTEKLVIILMAIVLAWVPRYRLFFKRDETAVFDGLLLGFSKLVVLYGIEHSWLKVTMCCLVLAMAVYCKKIEHMAPTNEMGQFWSVHQGGAAEGVTLEDLIGAVEPDDDDTV
ncbi:hypothetical protein FRX31_013216 [Thalictrum thalictroides]|uniref:Uncharacterized protein n=1 Tax=Thalictrum thalictroides TaxID=46969 RepID=A0A7J6WIJ7_THATH|nr:hypothetical protein FRX31_013216 [Thalictrum thalictroides]